MASGMTVPTVTQEDLSRFHVQNFGAPAPSNGSMGVLSLGHREGGNVEDLYEDDDDLGHYPDGRKRTLTDAQIAMFRESEIYSIIRERQVRRENKEADEMLRVSESDPRDQMTPISRRSHEAHERPKATYEEQNANKSNKRQKTDWKQPWEDGSTGFYDPHSRRYVRELDAATGNEQELDYGEEPELDIGHAEEESKHGETTFSAGRKIWWPILES